jgi:hypothetical protein
MKKTKKHLIKKYLKRNWIFWMKRLKNPQ